MNNDPKPADNCKCDALSALNKSHSFVIIHGTGALDGIPTWKCQFCNKKVKAT